MKTTDTKARKPGPVKPKTRPRASKTAKSAGLLAARGGPEKSESFSVRKIANGWVTTHSWEDKTGYRSLEQFSTTKPTISVPGKV